MDNLLNYSKGVVAIVGTALTWLFGAWDTALMVLVCFMAFHIPNSYFIKS